MLNRYEKGFSIFIVFMLIFLLFNVTLLTLSITLIAYSSSFHSYKDIPPYDITIKGLKNISFEKNNYKNIEYYSGMPRLGETGDINFDCYSGICVEEVYHNDYGEDDIIYDNSWKPNSLFLGKNISDYLPFISKNIIDKNFTKDIKTFSYSYNNIIDYDCSRECAINGKNFCTSCSIYKYVSSEGKCSYQTKISYDSEKYCYSNNIILKWRGYLYSRTYNDGYSFIKNAILPNETCPDNKILCGILDDYGHKLCLPKGGRCPINKIVFNNTPNDGYKYNSIKMDNLTLYYTTEAGNNGRIIGSLNVDSTISVQNECNILDTIPLLDLVEDNRNIYINQKSKITSEDKAYLKWCPAIKDGLEDLVKSREEYNIYLKHININKYIINQISDDEMYFGAMIHIIALILLLRTIILKYSEDRICSGCNKCNMKTILDFIIFCFLYGFACAIVAGGSINYSRKLKKILKDVETYNIEYQKLYKIPTMINLNLAFISLGFIFIPFLISFFIAYCCVNDTEANNSDQYKSYK